MWGYSIYIYISYIYIYTRIHVYKTGGITWYNPFTNCDAPPSRRNSMAQLRYQRKKHFDS